jgi:hypothetical protein
VDGWTPRRRSAIDDGMTLVITTPFKVRLRDAWANLLTIRFWLLARLGLLKPKVRQATGYWRKGVTYVHPQDELVPGHLQGRPPAAKFASDAPPAAVGAAIHEALGNYRIWVRAPHVRSAAYKAWFKTYLGMLDARTHAEVMKASKLVGIAKENGVVSFHPWRNEGARRGFTPMPPATVVEAPADASPDDLGRALAEAFARCG